MGASGGPLVVHDEGRLLDVCDLAAVRGAAPGMPLSQARALLAGARFVGFERETFREAQGRWLDQLVPFSDAIEPLSMHEAAIDLSMHPRPGEIARQVVQAVATVEPRVASGAGPSLWLARLAIDRESNATRDPARFLAPLPVSLLTPVNPSVRERLGTLGYQTIGDLQSVSLDVLRRQFGTTALTIQAAAMGRVAQPVRPLYPPGSAGGYVGVEGGTSSEQTLEAVLDRLAGEIGKRLAEEDRQTCELSVYIEHENGGKALSRSFVKPIGDPRSLRIALGILVGERCEEDVYGVRATLPHLRRKAQHQAALFGQVADRERIAPAIGRLQSTFGDTVVRRASELHVPRRVRFLKALSFATGWK